MRRSSSINYLFLCATLAAQELLTPGEQVLRDLRAALAREDEKQCVALLREVGGLYRYPASPAEAKALLGLAGEAARARNTAIAVAALHALGETRAPSSAALIEPHLRSLKPAAGQERVVLAAVQAAGKLRRASFLPALSRLAQKCSDLTIADQAFVALGAFRAAAPALRKQATEKVLEACRFTSRRRARWNRLRAPGLRALQRLTGRKLNSLGQFADWWRYARTLPDAFG